MQYFPPKPFFLEECVIQSIHHLGEVYFNNEYYEEITEEQKRYAPFTPTSTVQNFAWPISFTAAHLTVVLPNGNR